MAGRCLSYALKGTVSIILNELPCKDGPARFTTGTIETFNYLINIVEDIVVWMGL